MSIIETVSYTKEEFEDVLDSAKAVVAGAIAEEFGIDMEKMDEWCKTHTIKLCKKSIFHTISDLWEKEKGTEESRSIRVVEVVV